LQIAIFNLQSPISNLQFSISYPSRSGMQTRNLIAWVIAAAALLPLGGCNRDDSPSARVVVYTSVDQPVAEPILREFEKKTGIKVDVQTDTEATKSAGLAARLQAEKANPQADVWWGNEVFHTINLAESGVLAAYDSPSANDIPQQFKDPQHRWAGYCLRARVLAVSAATGAPPDVKNVTGLEAMRNPAFKNRVAMARPSAGTTGGHVAALYVIWGDEKADAFSATSAATASNCSAATPSSPTRSARAPCGSA
jgi:iron(III) transport system substrate-binding protein